MQNVIANAGCKHQFIDWFTRTLGWIVDIVCRAPHQRGFHVLRKRWIVERTLDPKGTPFNP